MTYKKFKLKNNLEVLHIKNTSPMISLISVWVRAGTIYEKINGLSHLMEHILFTGTKNRSRKKLIQDLGNIGTHNGKTNKVGAHFYIKTTNQDIEKALDIISDQIINSDLSQESLQQQKKIINEEIKKSQNNISRNVFNISLEYNFNNTAISKDVLGTKSIIQRITLKNLKDYYKNFYNPANALLIILSNKDTKHIKALAQKYFSAWSEGKHIKPDKIKFTIPDEKILKKKITSSQKYCVINYPIYKKISADEYTAMEILQFWLGQGLHSPIIEKIRGEHNLAYEVFVSFFNFKLASLFQIKIPTSQPQKTILYTDQAINMALSELDEQKLKTIKNNLIRHLNILSATNPTSEAFFSGNHWLLTDKVESIKDIIKQVKDIKLSYILKTTKKYLNSKNKYISIIK